VFKTILVAIQRYFGGCLKLFWSLFKTFLVAVQNYFGGCLKSGKNTVVTFTAQITTLRFITFSNSKL
jgi:hypothetical protein